MGLIEAVKMTHFLNLRLCRLLQDHLFPFNVRLAMYLDHDNRPQRKIYHSACLQG